MKSISVLHVDDDPDLAALVATFLEREREEIRVVTETDPRDARERFAAESGEIDCVVSDYDMPGMDGLELLGELRAIDPEIPFILFTGHGNEAIASEAISVGVTDYLRKGTGTDQYAVLANRVVNAVSKRRAECELERRTEQFEKTFEFSRDALFIFDPVDETIRECNTAACTMLGYDREELLDLSPEAIQPDQMDEFHSFIDRVLETGEGWTDEFTGLASDGRQLSSEISASRIDLDGRPHVLASVRDITARKERQRELERSRARFRALTENTTFAVLTMDANSTIRYANDAVEELFGYPPDELVGESLAAVIPDSLEADHFGAIERYLRDGERRLDWEWIELPARRRDGHEVPIGVSFGEYVVDGEHLFTGVLRDITDRKEREAELERYERIVETTDELVYTLDADGRVTFVNEAFSEFTGYDSEAILGRSAALVMDEADFERFEREIRDLIETGERETTLEVDLVTADGERVPCEDHLALRDGADTEKFRGTVGIVRDISDRKERQRELERSENLLGKTQRIASVGGWELDLRTDELRWTDEINRIYGFEPGYEPGLNEAIEAFLPEDRAALEDAMERAIEGGEDYDIEARLCTANGDLRWVRALGEPHRENGETVVLRGTLQDITDRKERERRFEAIFNQTFQFTGLLDPDGTLLEANETALAFGGIDRDDVVGEYIWDSHWWADTPEGQARVREAVKRARDGEFVRYEQAVKGAEGAAIIDFSIKPVTDEGGEVVLLVPEGRDITDRKGRERELRSTRDVLSTLLSSMPAGVLAESSSRDVLFANRSLCELFSIPADPDDLVGTDCAAAAEELKDLFVDSERFVTGNETAVTESRPVSREEFALVDGRTVERSGTPIPVPENDGEDRYLWLYHDITERKEVEQTLRALHEGTREMMEATTREEVCEIAAETSKRVLGHSITVVRLLAADGETLVPAAQTTETREQIGERPAYSIYDTPAGKAFREGLAKIHDDLADLDEASLDASYDPGNSRAAMYVPLGAHGVMSIADTDADRFDRSDLQLAKVLAANAETALDRVDHERTLEALHEGTRQMMDAETPEEVGELAVETARDALGLALTGFWSYDPDDVCLRPTVFTEEGHALFDEFPTYTPGNSLSWDAFVTGELALYDDVSTEPGSHDPETPIASEMIVPLGDYGVLNSGSTDPGKFDALDVSAARILAANAEAALARAEREALLRDRETQLERERDNLAALFENVPDPMYRYHREDGVVVPDAVNPAFERVFGYEERDVVGRPLTETIVPAERTDEHEKLAAAATADNALDAEVERRTATGRRTFLLRNAPIDVATDTSTAGYAIYTDVTERHEAEEYRRRLYEIVSDAQVSSEERVRGLLDLGRERLDLETAFLTRIDEGTQRIVEACGPHEAIEPGTECPLPQAYCRRTIEADSPVTIGHAGEAGWEDDPAYERFGLEAYVGSKLTIDGTTYGTVCFADREPRERDFSAVELAFIDLVTRAITSELERRRYERELERQNERLEQFASVLSHDLRNPLGIAEGYLEFIPAEGNEEYLEKVHNAHDRMERIIEDVLTLTRQGKTVVEQRVLPLAAVAETAWEHVETGRARLVTADDLGHIEADRSRLETLFENLFRNAITHAGEDVTVRVERTPTGFAVSDDGPGIEPAEREQVFEYGHTTGSGTGLGLSIVRTVADAHGWEVAVAASDVGGARFELSLPDAASG